MGLIDFHKNLLPDNYDRSLVRGGGQFIIENDFISFFGKSYDFGSFTKEDFESHSLPSNISLLIEKKGLDVLIMPD